MANIQAGQIVDLVCGHPRTVMFNDSHSDTAKLWCDPCDGMRSQVSDTAVDWLLRVRQVGLSQANLEFEGR